MRGLLLALAFVALTSSASAQVVVRETTTTYYDNYPVASSTYYAPLSTVVVPPPLYLPFPRPPLIDIRVRRPYPYYRRPLYGPLYPY